MKKVILAIALVLVSWSIFEIVLYTFGTTPEPKAVLTVKEPIKAPVPKKKDPPQVVQKSKTQPGQQVQSSSVSRVVKSEKTAPSEPALFYPKTTAELEKLFEKFDRLSVPRIYVGAFPPDFKEKGSPALFAKTLLPLILAENEKIVKDRRKLLPIVAKLRQGEQLSAEEKQFFDYLTTQYDVVEVGPLNIAQQLLQRVDRVSPALAVTQALEQTKDGKDLTSIFGIYKWNDKEEFVFATYPDLRKAVANYTLHLNTTVPYYVFWELRTLNRDKRQPMKARVFMDGLRSYRYGDRTYAQKLAKVYDKYGLFNLDEAQLEKEKR